MKEYKEYQKMREERFKDWGYYSTPINGRNVKSLIREFFQFILKDSKVRQIRF